MPEFLRSVRFMPIVMFVWGSAYFATTAEAQSSACPAAWHLPQLTIDDIRDPHVPVEDRWQIFWGSVPLSDMQLAQLARKDMLIDSLAEEMNNRGMRVYLGMATGAVGTSISSMGWLLFGKGSVEQRYSLPMAVGGLVVGIVGVLWVTESIQIPLEPHLAPTPRHRMSRNEVQKLVAQVNNRLYREICDAIPQARAPSSDGSSFQQGPGAEPAMSVGR